MAQLKIVITERQKASRIAFLNDRIKKIRTDLANPTSAVHELYSSNSPKKDMIILWAEYVEELHDLGEYKNEVNSISSYIKKELKTIGLEQAIHYVHEVLPFKYKNEDKSHSNSEDEDLLGGSTTQNSSEEKPKIPFEIENKNFIDCIDDTVKLLKFIKKELHNRHFCNVLDVDELEEFLTLQDNLIDTTYNVWNEKKKDMTQTQAALFELALHCNPSFAAGEYMSKIKELFKFTPKQAIKILKGEIRELHILYEPKNRIEACLVGYYGQRCGQCGSWRVKYLPQKTLRKRIFHQEITKEYQCYCFACTDVFDAKTEKIVVK